MSGRRYSPEEIKSKLREAEVYLAEGLSVGEVIRRLGVNKIRGCRQHRHSVRSALTSERSCSDASSVFFISEPFGAKQFRQARRMHANAAFFFKNRCEFRHRDVRPFLDAHDDEVPVRTQFARTFRPALPGRLHRTGLFETAQQPYRRRWRNLKL